MNKFFHPFHLVTESPWPMLGSFLFLIVMVGFIKFFNSFNMNIYMVGNILLMFVILQWWRDVIREGTIQGNHTIKVVEGIKLGMILFILSEVMFFISFFWGYFYMFLSPSVEVGSIWPPQYILVFNPYNIPLLNTLILLSSGVTITWCHYLIYKGIDIKNSEIIINLTIILGMLFIVFQYMEYKESYFSMTDSIYGSVFFMMTGFHGVHVIIGVMFITISMSRLVKNHFSSFHHFGFEAASWYWHFVDVVWLFLYIFVYWLSF